MIECNGSRGGAGGAEGGPSNAGFSPRSPRLRVSFSFITVLRKRLGAGGTFSTPPTRRAFARRGGRGFGFRWRGRAGTERLCVRMARMQAGRIERIFVIMAGNPRRVGRTIAGGPNFFLNFFWGRERALESGSRFRYGRVAQKPKLRLKSVSSPCRGPMDLLP
jgi:hypothetical protein